MTWRCPKPGPRKPDTRNPKTQTRIPNPAGHGGGHEGAIDRVTREGGRVTGHTLNPKPETRNLKPETRNHKP